MASDDEWICVRGAREHNLHNVDVDLPRDRFTVITGPSGSGKSSLAFDTLHAEGQRRYLETLRVNSRALFDQLRRPDVDAVEGMPPPLCVSQQTSRARPRSTLATITELDDFLRLLWSRLGTPHCYNCGRALARHTIGDIVRAAGQWPEGTRVLVLAPLVRDSKGDNANVLRDIRQAGFLRARIDGAVTELQESVRLNPKQKHTIDMVVDRLVLRPGMEDRLRDSLDSAVRFGSGRVILADVTGETPVDHAFSTRYYCADCDIAYGELQPRDFSFNNPHGACPTCTGLGFLPAESTTPAAEAEDAEDDDAERTAAATLCPDCGGARLNREARSVRFEGKTLPEVHGLTVTEALTFFTELSATEEYPSPPRGERGVDRSPEQHVRAALTPEITKRLHFLEQVGLGYLTLGRRGPTLSGGEAQRTRLAGHLGAGLLGVCYILDEPTIGLHPRDTQKLLTALRALQERGSTLVVVEHDEAVIRAADYLVEIGPGPGPAGGRVVAAGPAAEVLPRILPPREALPERTPLPAPRQMLRIFGAREHNLQNIDVELPLGRLVCVTGVSGSGKSTLVYDVLAPALRGHLGLTGPLPGACDRIEGLEQLDRLIEVDQSPLGRSLRSIPATYTGMFDEIRKLFAATREAKSRGWKANRFSFNVRGGRCEECQGQGVRRVALDLMPELAVPCPRCHGRRFDPSLLDIRFKGKSIADVLDLSMAEALALFANVPALFRPLEVLVEIGLGYLKLGQPSGSLSGGEAQRVKLATELSRTATGRTMLLLDEPTTGLGSTDVRRLLTILRRLADAGNSVVVIEHNLELIAAADWIIDLGPEAGAAGGRLVAAGAPADLIVAPASLTGEYLRRYLGTDA